MGKRTGCKLGEPGSAGMAYFLKTLFFNQTLQRKLQLTWKGRFAVSIRAPPSKQNQPPGSVRDTASFETPAVLLSSHVRSWASHLLLPTFLLLCIKPEGPSVSLSTMLILQQRKQSCYYCKNHNGLQTQRWQYLQGKIVSFSSSVVVENGR